ncbi:hypothetical protein [Devosia sp. A16]|uniref:hypothetical protein n=1 Tax=Devosia sp. A16 TaxID=1736675 RepID=UPI0006D7BB5B|nr:hypothetical protein [Devosia sp. A16]
MSEAKSGAAISGPRVLRDEDVLRLADMPAAIAAVEQLFARLARQAFVAPPRQFVPFDRSTDLVFSTGGMSDGVAGTRAYVARNGKHHDDQLVVVWDMPTGRMKGVVLGSALGVLRMGAIGGAAIRARTRPDAGEVAVIGAGRQAAAHLEAAARVRPLRRATVFARSAERTAAFCAEMGRKLQLAVSPATSAEAALDGAEIVIVATSSLRPVIAAGWLRPDAYVHSVGYKSTVAREMDLDVAEAAATIVTDSPAQVTAFGSKFILHGTSHGERVEPLWSAPMRPGITLCYPMGVTGSDVVVADELLRRAELLRPAK